MHVASKKEVYNLINNCDKSKLNRFIKNNYKNNPKQVIYQWSIHESFPFEINNFISDKRKLNSLVIGHEKGKVKFNTLIKKDYNLGFVLGLLLSEGTHHAVRRNKREVYIKISNNSKKLLEKFRYCFKQTFGVNSINNENRKYKNIYCLNVGYNMFSLILENIFEYKKGEKSWDKKVPSVLYNSPESCIKGFIEGFWLGDGSTHEQFYRIHTTSINLVNGIMLILLRLGIFSRIYEYKKRKENHHNAFEIRISNLDSIKKFENIIKRYNSRKIIKSSFSGDRIPKIGIMLNSIRRSCSIKTSHKIAKMLDWSTMEKKNKSISMPTVIKVLNLLKKYKPTSKYYSLLTKYVNGDIYWDKIKSVKKVAASKYTVDFCVEPTNNFIGGKGCILLHNSDTVMDDIEAMMMTNRERMGFIPEEKGGAVAGKLTVIDKDSETGKELRIDCTKFGSGAYSIPSTVEHLKFETDAKFVLAIETSGAFERLNKHAYWKTTNSILVAMGGVPTRATRRFIRKLSDDMDIPVYVFTDGDPYGYLNIYRTLKVGSGNAAHINEFFCVPRAQYIGVTPQDIIDYKLPTHQLKDIDVKRIEDGMKNDPFVQHYKEWQKALQQMVKMKQRVEQQAFAKHGLNMVIDKYLPEKLANPKSWLP